MSAAEQSRQAAGGREPRPEAAAAHPGALERQLSQMIVGSWVTQAIAVAAELAVSDLLAGGPRSAEDLAREAGVHAPSLHRLLRALASAGLFAQDDGGRFALTGLGRLLAGDAPGSKRDLALMAGAEFYRSWGGLLGAVRTGTPAFEEVFGSPFFSYMGQHPERWRIYDAAMNGVHGAETHPVLDAYDLSAVSRLVDVGGGNGAALAEALRRHPHLEGVLYDLPDVARRAREALAASDVAGRCSVVGGSFFDAVPPGADAYFLRHVLHDWEDEEAAAILRRCAEAMRPDGRVLVVETVIPAGDEPCFGKWLDLMMLVVGGRERTLDQYARVFAAAGLRLERVVPTAHEVSVLEGVRAG